MIVYTAGWHHAMEQCGNALKAHGTPVPFLFSYAAMSGRVLESALRWPGPRFLDSGAFTAATSGVPIRLSDYIAFCEKHAKSFGVVAALDVIGDEDATWVNYRAMLSAGLAPIPTWHISSSERALHRILAEAEYFAVGGMVGMRNRLRNQLLRRVWDTIYTRAPSARVHGFGLTRTTELLAFPWYSVDSSAVVRQTGYGRTLAVQDGSVVFTSSKAGSSPDRASRILTSLLTVQAKAAAITRHWQQHTYVVGRGCTPRV